MLNGKKVDLDTLREGRIPRKGGGIVLVEHSRNAVDDVYCKFEGIFNHCKQKTQKKGGGSAVSKECAAGSMAKVRRDVSSK